MERSSSQEAAGAAGVSLPGRACALWWRESRSAPQAHAPPGQPPSSGGHRGLGPTVHMGLFSAQLFLETVGVDGKTVLPFTHQPWMGLLGSYTPQRG